MLGTALLTLKADTVKCSTDSSKVPPYLSIDSESTGVLLKFNGCNSWNLSGLLYVAAMRSYSKSH